MFRRSRVDILLTFVTIPNTHLFNPAMSFQTPASKVSIAIDGLGTLDGFRYANGVEQFCGIPYATLAKRWTRSLLKTSWENEYHDGTQLG